MTGPSTSPPDAAALPGSQPLDWRADGAIVLISCYELGHQPIGVALPMGFLGRAGFAARALDIAVSEFDDNRVNSARFVGISVPMHTALRLGVRVMQRIREINPDCHICFYGLYAALNSDFLLEQGADSCLGGEYDAPLVSLVEALESGHSADPLPGVIRRDQPATPYLERLEFAVPSREDLPPLTEYAQLLHEGDCHTAGYTEASRGCLHLCTHCPIPPVYGGRFFVVPTEVVVEDIARQVEAGATHITFGDPDFLNGPRHSIEVVREMHQRFPTLTFDFTAKIEHLLSRGDDLPEFGRLGCLFIISAVESLSPTVLKILDKQHTADDVTAAIKRCRQAGVTLRPTWVAFTPWTTLDDYLQVLEFIETNDLVDHVDPVQFSIRLLIPPGSWLAEHPATLPYRGRLDETALSWTWAHPDPRMDRLQRKVAKLVEQDATEEVDPATTFARIRELAHGRSPDEAQSALAPDRRRAPRLSESWFC
jgi:radical SAM superfamily enzyme YgiQ (UPF0313 family)